MTSNQKEMKDNNFNFSALKIVSGHFFKMLFNIWYVIN